ncbi:DegT/DnrJ/EryC1/StrS family aminotransferase [Sphingomicrobium marinum]|uniref:DegT/DnrJ/EryC1/StrS family aminotransferase n=1 Tax=Sphingomicrobium marinum TaxID=1227950 RepID=UPI0022405BD6|nr:DegT/DnrJ/EryC1/StrS aminotransferase family protein [Sphingomicrobium marinum]
MSMSPWPSFGEEEISAVADVLRSNKVNYWTGQEGREFEKEFAAAFDSKHAIAVANGTVALDLALIGIGIGPGDEVIVTPRTFLASVSSVVTAGATPVFADVDRNSGNIEAHTIEPVITDKTKAIIPVHLAGWPADMDPIMALADKHGLKVIEDCAQAHGARYKGKSVGSIGHVGAWSFCQDKIMTTGGEGGMVTTDDEEMWSRMWSYKDHGKSWDAVYNREHAPGFRWLHESFGTNWRMTELQSVIGRKQVAMMPAWHQRRTDIASAYQAAWGAIEGLRLPRPAPDNGTRHAWYKFYGYVEPEKLAAGWDRDRIIAEIVDAGVPCFQGSCSEVYNEKAFDGTGLRPEAPLPVAKELGETSIMWLCHPTLTDEEVEKVATVSADVLRRAFA